MVSFLKRLLLLGKDYEEKVYPGQYPFLVTGCARSGTHFLSKFLQLNGLDIGHEVSAPLGTVGWVCGAEDYRKERQATFSKTAHLVRHPALVIKSLQTINPRAWRFIHRYTPECANPDPIVAAARYWVSWNKMTLAQSSLSVRLEDFTETPLETVKKLETFFDGPLNPDLIAVAQSFGDSRKDRKDYGHGVALSHVQKHDPSTWENIRQMADMFEYSLLEVAS